MYPILFRIGNFPITSFGLMMLVSFISGAWVTSRMSSRYGLDSRLIWDMLPWIALAGIVGAKVYFLLLHWPDVLANPRAMIFAREGLVWYGGLIGGVLAYYLQVRMRKLPLAVMFDATVPGLFLAVASGRIGCFLVGDDYGIYTEAPVGVAFPQGTPPSTAGYLRSMGDFIPASISNSTVVSVHPTQLYEVAIALVLFTILWQIGKRWLKPGRLFASFVVLYAIERFLIEVVRVKGDRFFLGLSTAQVISVFLVIAGLILWHRQGSKADWSAAGAAPEPTSTAGA
jgi:phosphatidylglycerol:prolipoprotein diacylglycerol transferase